MLETFTDEFRVIYVMSYIPLNLVVKRVTEIIHVGWTSHIIFILSICPGPWRVHYNLTSNGRILTKCFHAVLSWDKQITTNFVSKEVMFYESGLKLLTASVVFRLLPADVRLNKRTHIFFCLKMSFWWTKRLITLDMKRGKSSG